MLRSGYGTEGLSDCFHCPWWLSKDWPAMKLAEAGTGAGRERRKHENNVRARKYIIVGKKSNSKKG